MTFGAGNHRLLTHSPRPVDAVRGVAVRTGSSLLVPIRQHAGMNVIPIVTIFRFVTALTQIVALQLKISHTSGCQWRMGIPINVLMALKATNANLAVDRDLVCFRADVK